MTASDFSAHGDLLGGLDTLGLDRSHSAPLLLYLELLQHWNRSYNLTAIRDPREMVTKHLLDSLAIHPFVRARTLADLGSGAGFPGIALAIVQPQLQVTLIEANGKKARFLREALRALELGNAQVMQSRIEAVSMPGAFDAITARALATLPRLLELGGQLLTPDGRLLAMKGARPDEELAALPAGWRVLAVHPLSVPGLAAARHLVEVGRDG